jgi:hypothetical protein
MRLVLRTAGVIEEAMEAAALGAAAGGPHLLVHTVVD